MPKRFTLSLAGSVGVGKKSRQAIFPFHSPPLPVINGRSLERDAGRGKEPTVNRKMPVGRGSSKGSKWAEENFQARRVVQFASNASGVGLGGGGGVRGTALPPMLSKVCSPII